MNEWSIQKKQRTPFFCFLIGGGRSKGIGRDTIVKRPKKAEGNKGSPEIQPETKRNENHITIPCPCGACTPPPPKNFFHPNAVLHIPDDKNTAPFPPFLPSPSPNPSPSNSSPTNGGSPNPSTLAKDTYPSIARHWVDAVRALNGFVVGYGELDWGGWDGWECAYMSPTRGGVGGWCR